MQWCGKMVCEEEVIRTVAVDSALRDSQLELSTPRVMTALYDNPFRSRATSVAPASSLGAWDWSFLRRIYPGLQLVSMQSAFTSDMKLTPGGPLVIVAPVSWRGDSAAVVRLAVFPAPDHHASEFYVRLHYRDRRWHVVRIEAGWIE
jgi:hypothetical protein